ncbi:MAG: transglutaminase-like domain-containing protein [Akkermansiaceae bacterium]
MKMLMILFTVMLSGMAFANEAMTRALVAAGENRAEVEIALASVPDEQREGLSFLVRYMPDEDLKSLTAEFLLENVALAYKARGEFAWARDLPEEIFFNDVLPYAVLDETRDNWRKDFYDRFSKHVVGATTMKEAIKAVNFAVMGEVKVKYSTKRKKPHQSPYESMEINVASCTGLSILLVDAFRAVGIPARVAGIPMWTTKRGNHNWVEVWTPGDKSWHCTEFNPDKSGDLDLGWYVKDASKANPESFYHSIYATSWKPTEIHFPMVWNMESKQVHGVNVSEFYIKLGGGDEKVAGDLCELRIDYTVAGERISVPVAVTQADVKLSEGATPEPTDDMNQFYSLSVKKGQMYQVVWKAPGEEKWRRVEVLPKQTKGEEPFLRVKLVK